jgi:transposase
MGRTTNTPPEIYDYDFVKLARNESHACTRERLLGMAHIQKHGSLTRTAEALFVHITTVQSWLNRFRREGLEGLNEKLRAGKKSHLTDDQLVILEKRLIEWSEALPGGRLTGKMIQDKIQQEFGVHYHLNS